MVTVSVFSDQLHITRTMRVSLAVKERAAPAPLVREMSVLSGEDTEDTSLNMGHASSALYAM